MSTERHERISRLFLDALEIDPDRQAAYLEEACPDSKMRDEVLDLLARDREGFRGLDPVAPRGGFPEVPGYRIVRLLGEGGMGVVYDAEQEAPRRRVALKVLRREFVSDTLLKRFAHEAHVLGQLEHPAIARIYQVGRAAGQEGVPFFVMELVPGLPLQQAAQNRGLTTRQRLELFARICDGVEYAHQKGIIHRDLKPGNILVTEEGDPKILDFGIARVTHADMQVVTIQTDLGQIVGTLPYMSPEQATGPSRALDTRTDVYSLGVVLYQLLSGSLPHDLTDCPLPDAIRIISDVEPRPVSFADQGLRGDVATIVRKALAKDRDHRYQTAAELAADIRRFLRDEPIVARPTSTIYALARFARRNKAVFAGLSVAVVALLLGSVVSVIFAVRARQESLESDRQAALARTEAKTARRFVDFVLEALRGLDLNQALAGEPTLRDAMDRVGERLEGDLSDEPLIRARLHAFLGNMYRNLGQAEQAGEHFRRAIAIYGDAKVESSDVVYALSVSSWFLFKAGQLAEAESQVDDARRMLTRIGQDRSEMAARCTTTAAEIALTRRDFVKATALIDETLALQRKLYTSDHDDVAVSLFLKGLICLGAGRPEEAESLLQASLEMRRRLFGGAHPLVAESLQGLSEVSYERGDSDHAESRLREAMAIREKTLPKGHPALASGFVSLGVLNYEREEYAIALEFMDKAASLYRIGYGAETPQMGTLLTHRAHALAGLGRFEEAETSAREAVGVLLKHVDESHREVVLARVAYGMLQRRAGRKQEGLETLLPAMMSIRGWSPGEAAQFQEARLETGALACEIGRFADAEAVLSDAVAEVERVGSDDPAFNHRIRAYLGLALLEQKRARDAEPHLLAALESARKMEKTPGKPTRWALDLLAELYTALGQPDRVAEYRGLRPESRQ